jgi:hypothetical protein
MVLPASTEKRRQLWAHRGGAQGVGSVLCEESVEGGCEVQQVSKQDASPRAGAHDKEANKQERPAAGTTN